MNLHETLTKLNEKMTEAEIGEAVCLSQATINRLKKGVHKSTSFEHGLAIIRLAEQTFGKHEQITSE